MDTTPKPASSHVALQQATSKYQSMSAEALGLTPVPSLDTNA